MQRHACVGQRREQPRHGDVGDRGVDQHRLGGVADAGPVGLGVQHDRLGHVQVGGRRPRTRGSCRRRSRWSGTVASRTTASISPAPPRGMTTSTRPRAWISCVTLERSWLGSNCTASAGRPCCVIASRSTATSAAFERDRRRRPAQQCRVAGLQGQPEGVDGDVGAGLVDHADDAERHPDLPDLQPVGQRRPAQHLTDRVGQARDLPQARGDPVDAGRVSRSRSSTDSWVPARGRPRRRPRWRRARRARRPAPHRQPRECGVLLRGGRLGESPRRDARATRSLVDRLTDVGGGCCRHDIQGNQRS